MSLQIFFVIGVAVLLIFLFLKITKIIFKVAIAILVVILLLIAIIGLIHYDEIISGKSTLQDEIVQIWAKKVPSETPLVVVSTDVEIKSESSQTDSAES